MYIYMYTYTYTYTYISNVYNVAVALSTIYTYKCYIL